MTQALSDVDVVEISFVPKAANKRKWLLLKGDSEMEMEELLDMLTSPLADEEEVERVLKAKGLSEKAIKAVEGALRMLSGVADELPEGLVNRLKELVGGEAEKAKGEGKGKKDEEYGYAYPKPTKKSEPEIPEDVQQKLDTLWKEREEAVKAAAQLGEKVADLEKIVKAQDSEIGRQKGVIEDQRKAARQKELEPLCKAAGLEFEKVWALEQGSPEVAAHMLEVVRKQAEQVDQAIGHEIGTERPSDTTTRLEGLVKEYIEKHDGATYGDAIVAVGREHPDLAREVVGQARK